MQVRRPAVAIGKEIPKEYLCDKKRISLGYKKNTIPMILSNPVGWVRDGDIQIFTYYIKV